MGGGDLNLKKSWHPSTMRNMEKVWKAEQKHDQEKKRIAELQREIREEREREDIQKHAEEQGVIEKKNEMKLEWMYKGPGGIVDREEYLLGRAIDKTFEQLQESEKPSTSSKGVVERSGIPVSNEQVDLARKLQEDPLFVIKKKELESRTQILKNPMKVKKLQKLLKVEKEKKHKKTKKKKKRRRDSSSCSSSSSTEGSESEQLDALLAAKYIRLKNKLHDMDLDKLKRSEAKRKYSDEEDEEQEGHSSKKYGLQRMSERKPLHSTVSRNTAPRETAKTQSTQKQYVKPERKRLTEEEMERRRQEMMQFAKERDEERKNNVARYKAQDEREKKQNKPGYSEDFMRKELSKAASLGTVASRIKSNINNIQRSRSDMDRNFARR